MGIGGRDTFGFLKFNSAFYIFGGVFSGSPVFYRDVWKSTDSGASWTLASSTSTGYYRYAFSYCVHNSAMYIAAGIGNNSSSSGVGNTTLNDVWYSNSDGSSWTNIGNLGVGKDRNYSQLVSDGTNLYVIGGFDLSSVPLNDVLRSADNGATWSTILANTASPGANQFAQRGYHQSFFANSKLWVVGGGGTGSTSFNDVWSSPDGITWTQVTASAGWTGRINHMAWAAEGRFWMASGVNPAAAISYNDVWISSNAGVTWTEIHPSTADPFSVSSLTRSGSTATGTTTTAHDLTVGVNALISGATQAEYNGNHAVLTVPTSTSFTYEVSGTPVTPATGTIFVSGIWRKLHRARGIYSDNRLWVAGGNIDAVGTDGLWYSGKNCGPV